MTSGAAALLERSIGQSAQAPLVSTLRGRLPTGVRRLVRGPGSQSSPSTGWASLPGSLDGRVRLHGGQASGRAGWRMLDVPSARRIAIRDGAAYLADGYDVVQTVDRQRLREYIVVGEHQGVRTWRWQLYGASSMMEPRLRADGRIDLGGGFTIERPRLLDGDLAELSRPVAWKLVGDELQLRVDDRGLSLPYVIDPDATPPSITVAKWTEGSPWAHYDAQLDPDRLYFNAGRAGSATAKR